MSRLDYTCGTYRSRVHVCDDVRNKYESPIVMITRITIQCIEWNNMQHGTTHVVPCRRQGREAC